MVGRKRNVEVCIIFFFSTSIFNIADIGVVEEECPGMNKDCLLKYFEDLPLARRYPVQIGHITKLSLENDQIREMKTLSMKPPLFEIPNFLSPEECDDIIRLAQNQGLVRSSTMNENSFEDVENFEEDQLDVFQYYDYNKDNLLDIDEISNMLDTEMDFSPDREDIVDMLKTLNLDKNGDLKVSVEEFQSEDAKGVVSFVVRTKQSKPYTKSRNSNQTWLETDKNSEKTLQLLRQRLQILTELPMMLLKASESLQVVSYGPRGHYNCHMDSDDLESETRCCHVDDKDSDCRICRYLTVLYFLSDVEEGGETAFPLADNETFDEDVWHKDVKRICNVGRNCHKSNLRVKPEKGKAILWYTHEINDVTGWLGETDPYSYHGGCDVKKGTKWIANNWITVSENRRDDIEFWIDSLQKAERKSQDQSDVFDKVFQTIDTESLRKEEEINAIFDGLKLSDIERTKTVNSDREEL